MTEVTVLCAIHMKRLEIEIDEDNNEILVKPCEYCQEEAYCAGYNRKEEMY